MKIALLGNITLDFFAQDFRRMGHEVYVPPGFDTWRQETLDPESGLHRFAPDATLLLLPNEDIFKVVTDLSSLEDPTRLTSLAPTLPLSTLAHETPGFWDDRMRRLAAMPFSLAGLKAIEEEFLFLAEFAAAPKKILAVDADNTLWRGIVSEDEPEAIVPYVDFQRGLLALKEKGVLLVLLSKNDPVFPFLRADMPLKDGDFAALKVNWAPKAGNLVEACRELNLGVESVVFLDDNPYERAQMAAHLPEVAVAPWDGVPGPGLVRRLKDYFFFDAGRTAEDRLRAADYAHTAAATELKRKYATVGDYLADLELKVQPSLATEADLDRLAQMAGKTNQFNATTIRRDRGAFAALLADETKCVFVFRTWDRFGAQGIVCYVVVDRTARRITDFVMSCRAMGRTLEHFVYGYVCDALGCALPVDCVATAKNAPFRAFLESGMKGPTYYARVD